LTLPLLSKQAVLACSASKQSLLANQNKAGKQSCPFSGQRQSSLLGVQATYSSLFYTPYLRLAWLACTPSKPSFCFRHNPARPLPSTLTIIYYFLWQAEKESHHE